MRQIFWIIIIVCVVIFGAAWYVQRSRTHAVTSGQVSVRGQADDKAKTDGAATASKDQPEESQGPAAAGIPTQQAAPAQSDAQAQDDAVTPPADSIPRNPPNGMVFAGTGKYQLYRQGDITWRLDTNTGQACVLFATNAEWRVARVYQHGCGGS